MHLLKAANMTYCSSFFTSPWDCAKRNVFLVASIIFTAVYLGFHVFNSNHHAVLTESEVPNNDNIEEKDIFFTKGYDTLQMKSENILHKNIISNFKKIVWKKIGNLPVENEKNGNKNRSASTQSFKFIINEKDKCKDETPFLILLIATTAAEIHLRHSIRNSWGNESVVPGVEVVRRLCWASRAKVQLTLY